MSYIVKNNKKYSDLSAKDIKFDNSGTTIESTNVNAAISELNKNIQTIRLTTNHMDIHSASSNENNYVTFKDVVVNYRIPALFIGNANGTPDIRACSLFSNGTVSDNSISVGGISAILNSDGLSDVTITQVPRWGNYCLIVFPY